MPLKVCASVIFSCSWSSYSAPVGKSQTGRLRPTRVGGRPACGPAKADTACFSQSGWRLPRSIIERVTALANDLELLPFLVLGFFTGIRPDGELNRLEWKHIRWENKSVL